MNRFKECYIIDINPGRGLWSSKIHEALRPRQHVLIEPEFDRYSKFLRPLLEVSGSRYRHVPYSPFEWTSYSRIFDEGLLPRHGIEQPQKGTVQGQIQVPFLILANLPAKGSSANLSPARYMISGFCSIFRRHEILNCMGQYRMLAWLPDLEKDKIIPRSVTSRDSYSAALELASSIYEIAGSGLTTGRYSREPEIEFRSALDVRSRMAANNRELPAGRRDLTHQAALKHPTNTLQTDISQNTFSHLIKSQTDEVAVAVLEERVKDLDSKERANLNRLRTKLRNARNEEAFLQGILDQMEQAYDFELALNEDLLSAMEQEEVKKKLGQIQGNIRHQELKMHRARFSVLNSRIDDRIAFKMNPPLLQWDRRDIEPLVVKEDEFSPNRKMSLIDITPKVTKSKVKPGSRDPKVLVIRSLFTTPADSIIRALDNTAPGASEALLPTLQNLHDPKKGGRYNLHDLRVRMLSPEYLQEITRAFLRWPFCPEKYRLSSS